MLINKKDLELKVKSTLMPNIDENGNTSIENAERFFLNLINTMPTVEGNWESHKLHIIHNVEGMLAYCDRNPDVTGKSALMAVLDCINKENIDDV